MAISRRRFVQGTLVSSGLLTIGCGNEVAPAPVLSQPLTTSGGKLVVALQTMVGGDLVAHYPDLAPVGGAITIPIVAGPGDSAMPESILLVHASEPPDPQAYLALDSACPHAGCPLGYSPSERLVECPCHGSRFAVSLDAAKCPTVTVSHPPAVAGPRAFPTALSIDNSTLTITLTAATTIEAPFSDYPELRQPGGVAVVHNPDACIGVIVVRKDESTVLALSDICTHAGCNVVFEKDANDLFCPCHHSHYDLDGNVTIPAGPNQPALPRLEATLTADGVTIRF
jgi:Rieske Fe-S protein